MVWEIQILKIPLQSGGSVEGSGVVGVVGVVVVVVGGGVVGFASFGTKSHLGISINSTSSMAMNPNSLSPFNA